MAKKVSVWSHIAASFISTAPHTHTGKRLKSHHSSHGALFGLLVMTGVLLFSNLGALRAYGLTSSGNNTVSVTINGDAPSQGASMSFPATNQITNLSLLQVTGICPDGTLVAIYNNGTFAGSTTCTTDGNFSLAIQLSEGANILQAQNYDGLNQAGPSTPQVTITYTPDMPIVEASASSEIVTTPEQLRPNPVVPEVPIEAPQPSSQPCYDLPNTNAIKDTARPIISVNCISRNVYAGETLNIKVLIQGGIAPYALFVDWGDTKTDLISVQNSSVQSLQHVYTTSGFHTVVMSTTDTKGASTKIQTVVSVNGTTAASGTSNPVTDIAESVASIWINAPVPLYFAALTLLLGFWAGDIYKRIKLQR
jgi:hypothetical protein